MEEGGIWFWSKFLNHMRIKVEWKQKKKIRQKYVYLLCFHKEQSSHPGEVLSILTGAGTSTAALQISDMLLWGHYL